MDPEPIQPSPILPSEDWRECPDCGLFCRLPPRQPGLVADCPRCGDTLWRMRRARRSFPLACALAGLLFYLFAVVAPFLEIEAFGRFSLARLYTGPAELLAQGFGLVAALVFAVTLITPAIKLAILLITLGGLRILPPRWLKLVFRWYKPVSPWAMIDVYLLGFLVAYTRLTGLALVHLDTAVFALIGFMLAMAAADGSMDIEQVWRMIHARETHPQHSGTASPNITHGGQHTLMGCEACHLVNEAHPGDACRRCHTILQPRKPQSISRTWALLLAAMALYIPANLYPFMIITRLAQTQGYTITGGILELAQDGLWPLAALVFFASITIPLLKILAMIYMLLATQNGSTRHLLGRTRAYRIIDFIGRWSMIDVFMVSILVALLRFGRFANVRADIGALCFAAVVVLTIFAAEMFDPRLMWDAEQST